MCFDKFKTTDEQTVLKEEYPEKLFMEKLTEELVVVHLM